MGWKYFDEKTWAEVSRDERSFCMELLVLARTEMGKFIRTLNKLAPDLALQEGDWELGFEVCLYRDLKYFRLAQGGSWPLGDDEHSIKRTFDLCLFSADRIIIVEAKAQQPFTTGQMVDFEKDFDKVEAVTGIRPELLLLASSRYLTAAVVKKLKTRFPESQTVSWRGLAESYDHDRLLLRADSLYADASRTGAELIELWKAGASLSVGRSGGIKALRNDLPDAAWMSRLYPAKVDGVTEKVNWFTLKEFVEAVRPDLAS